MSSEDWMLSVHCDWEKCLQTEGGAPWVLYKERGQPSVSSKLRRTGEGGLECDDGEKFSAELISERLLRVSVSAPESSRTVFLLAPSASHQVASRLTSLDVSVGGLGVSSSSGPSVSVWSTESGTVRRELGGHLAEVYTARLFPSGLVALTAGADMSLKIWSVETGDCPVTLSGHTGPVTATQIVGRGKNIVSVSKDGTGRLWSCGERRCLGVVVTLSEQINCCHLAPSHNSIFHPLEAAQPTDPAEVETEDKVLAVGGEAGTVTVVRLSSRAELFTTNLASPVNAIVLCRDGLYVGCQDGAVHLIRQAGTAVIRASTSPVLSMMRLHTERTEQTEELVVTSRQDGSVTLYLAGCRVELTGSDTDPVYDLAEDPRCVYTACRDGRVRKYDRAVLLRIVEQQLQLGGK